MEYKKCNKCGEVKSVALFNANKSKKDGLQTYCRDCSNYNNRKYYEHNKIKQRTVSGVRKRRIVSENRDKSISILMSSGCVDCANMDIRVLEFDHVRGSKFKDVSFLINCGYSWDVIKNEIDKCEVVCANCHRIRTFERSDNFKNRVYKKINTHR